MSFGSARRGKCDPLSKKTPQNPKYRNVKATVDTGASMTKYLDRIEEIKKNYKLRKDEIFKRMKITTFVQLVMQIYMTHEAENFDALTPPDTAGSARDSADEEVKQVTKSGSPVPSLALTDGDFGERKSVAESARSTLNSVAHGVGELDLNRPRTPAEIFKHKCPYLLLDVRDADEYRSGHIKTAQSYPKAILSRSVNYESRDMLMYKNKEQHIIILYDWDERLCPSAANTLVQRGYDNLFMVSGGLKLALKLIPTGLYTAENVSECGSFSEEDISALDMNLDNALQDNSVGTTSRLSQTSTASSRMSSRATVRSTASEDGRPPFR